MHTPGADTDSPSDTPPNSVYIPGAPHCIVLQPAHISLPEGSQDMAGVHFRAPEQLEIQPAQRKSSVQHCAPGS